MTNVPSTFTGDYWRPGVAGGSGRIRAARRFFVIAVSVLAGASLVAAGLAGLIGRSSSLDLRFPPAFVATTLLLGVGSGLLEQARQAIRREQQPLFRRRLTAALVAAGLFMGVQTYALWTILPAQRSADLATTGVVPFVVMLATLHGLHFLVATLFLSYVAAQASVGRYDHEYHWGVTVCAWFWHVLGIVWLGILAVYLIAFR